MFNHRNGYRPFDDGVNLRTDADIDMDVVHPQNKPVQRKID